MIACDEQALICDLAESYQIFNYRSLPIKTVATLSAGLRENSRIKMKMSGLKVDQNTLLLATIADRAGGIIYMLGGLNEPPPSFVEQLCEDVPDNDMEIFDSIAEFEEARRKIIGNNDE